MKLKKIISNLLSIALLSASAVVPTQVSAARTAVFFDDFESHSITSKICGTNGTANTIVNDTWATSAVLGGDTNNSYAVDYDVRLGNGYDAEKNLPTTNKTLALTPTGGVGGKKEYAQLMAAGLATGKHRAYVGGTLAANPLSALAGYTAIKEIARTNACVVAGKAGDRLADGLQELLDKYGLPFACYNQGSIVHLECTGAMNFDFSSFFMPKSAIGLLKKKDMMYERKDSMERMGAAYMANGIVTLAGSRLYTSMADTDEVIDEALNRFENVFKHVVKTNKGLVK